MFQQYYDASFYGSVISPVFSLAIKLASDEAANKEYWDVIVDGWMPPTKGASHLRKLHDENFGQEKPVQDQHYRHVDRLDDLSEHQALTVFLQYWTTLHQLWDSDLLDKKLSRKLFRTPFSYYRNFLFELSDKVKARLQPDQYPGWIDAVAFLDKRL